MTDLVELTPREKQVLAIMDTAPAAGVNASYVAHGDHGLPGPSNIATAGDHLRVLVLKGVLVRAGQNPPTYRRATEEQR